MSDSPQPLHPMAYYLTWNTYGSWPQGDPRGWIQRGDPVRRGYDPVILSRCRERQRDPTVTLTRAQRSIVTESIDRACAWGQWAVHARAVRTQHIHLVLSALMAPRSLLIALKGEATRDLRSLWYELDDRRIWARHGYVERLYTAQSVRRAVIYVLDDHHR